MLLEVMKREIIKQWPLSEFHEEAASSAVFFPKHTFIIKDENSSEMSI